MIELKNVTFGYPGTMRDIYEDFSISLSENKIYGLLGKNGMGKSTLLYLICGLLRASSGKITVDGYDAQLRRPEMLREIMIVPEEFELPKVTLDEYVMINAPFYPRFSKDVLVNCLQNFELPLSLRLDQLSMGQKKKVYMSFALAANTKYLLMDEPTNGLDIPSKSQFRKVVASNMSADRTIIISTHQVKDLESIIDPIIILDHKGVLLNRSVEEISERLHFSLSANECKEALYSQQQFNGFLTIKENLNGEETKPDLEALFNCCLSNKERIKEIFK